MTTSNSFGARAALKTAAGPFEIFRLDALERRGLGIARLPYSLRILLENLESQEDPGRRDRVYAGPRLDAGLHRRAGRR